MKINGTLSIHDAKIIAVLIAKEQNFYYHAKDMIYLQSKEELVEEWETYIAEELISETTSFEDWLVETQLNALESGYEIEDHQVLDRIVLTPSELEEKLHEHLERQVEHFKEMVEFALEKSYGKGNNMMRYIDFNEEAIKRDDDTNDEEAVTGEYRNSEQIVSFSDDDEEYRFILYEK